MHIILSWETEQGEVYSVEPDSEEELLAIISDHIPKEKGEIIFTITMKGEPNE